MKIGLVGLGKMGLNLALNMKRTGHQVYGTDVSGDSCHAATTHGIPTYSTLGELVSVLPERKILWVMVPNGEPLAAVLKELRSLLQPGDVVIDGGNSNYQVSARHSADFATLGIDFLDVGTSGGTSGANAGACLMVGGSATVVEELSPLFSDLSVTDGYLYTGKSGSGHFLKMVHNGIEYGMMQAMAEGFEVLEKGPYDYDLAAVAKVWNNGSVIRSWLMALAEEAFTADGKLEQIKGIMHSSGEGKWTVETALDYQVPTPVIALSLMMRYRSLQDDTFTGKVVAALRNGFGGHEVERHN